MPEPEDIIRIRATNIDAAAGEIIGVLEDTSKGNVIYFSGWCGFGASAALRVVAQRLKSSKSKFDKVIHVDCSVWKSMRALQKAVAKELELPQSVMAIFDRCDEDDDFNGIDEGSRRVIADIGREIYEKLAYSRFVVVFHNGSRRYIDLLECGVPAIAFLRNKVLWTWHGRFRISYMVDDGEPIVRLDEEGVEVKKMRMQTNVYIRTYLQYEVVQDLVCQEAKEIANCTIIAEPDYMNHKVVKQCVLYEWVLRNIVSPRDVELDTGGPNYWVCDGIIQGQGNTSAWEISNSVHRNMHSDWVRKHPAPDYTDHWVALLMRNSDVDDGRWVYARKKDVVDTSVVLPGATSCFLLPDEPPLETLPVFTKNNSTVLPISMFQHSQNSKLRVLYLSGCTFSFASPPFLCCSQLRLLHLDHCTSTTDDDEYQSHNENISCFQKLWVLDLRYTDWCWLLSEKVKRLMVELRELNVEGVKHGSINDLCGGRPSLVILRVAADPVPTENEDTNNQAQFPSMSSTNSLTTFSCINNVLPPWLESFSFINKATSAANITIISFRGCTKLKSILLTGLLENLEELDFSGTSVKTLDLREVEAPNLKRLILFGCEKLCVILWPPENKRTRVLEMLRINTIQSTLPSQANSKEKTNEASSVKRSSSILPIAATHPEIFSCNGYIAVRDARLLRSLAHPVEGIIFGAAIYMERDSSPASRVAVGGSEVAQRIMSLHQPDHYLCARDIVFQDHLQAGAANEYMVSWLWACPPRPTPSANTWHVHIQDEHEMKGGLLQQEQSSIEGTIPPSSMCHRACVLHVHDSSSIACISRPDPQGSAWEGLQWCRVERCSKLGSVFATLPKSDNFIAFRFLSTFWASQLPEACYIWNWSTISQPSERSFECLKFLHLDYCPRLIHVLPLYGYMPTLPSLETLEIVCCGDLKEVFPLDPKGQEQLHKTMKFPKLRHIHLYELSSLQSICRSRMSAPNLETVKIRGCWVLRRMPAVSGSITDRPKVDCEKDWWDNLEWEGLEVNHDPSLYEPRHSRYYKKDHLPRGTVLR